jgi:hypothetical protein
MALSRAGQLFIDRACAAVRTSAGRVAGLHHQIGNDGVRQSAIHQVYLFKEKSKMPEPLSDPVRIPGRILSAIDKISEHIWDSEMSSFAAQHKDDHIFRDAYLVRMWLHAQPLVNELELHGITPRLETDEPPF